MQNSYSQSSEFGIHYPRREKVLDIGGHLRRLREARGLSQETVAKRVGWVASYVSKVENNKVRRLDRQTIIALARALETDSSELLQAAGFLPDVTKGTPPEAPRQRTPDEIIDELRTSVPKLVPLVSQFVSAGGGTLVTSERIPYFPNPEERKHDHFAVRVSGKCLEPAITEGHIVIVDRDGSPQPGDYVVAVQDDQAVVKILRRHNGQLTLTDYAGDTIIPVTNDTIILGVVRAVHYVPPKAPSL